LLNIGQLLRLKAKSGAAAAPTVNSAGAFEALLGGLSGRRFKPPLGRKVFSLADVAIMEQRHCQGFRNAKCCSGCAQLSDRQDGLVMTIVTETVGGSVLAAAASQITVGQKPPDRAGGIAAQRHHRCG
jgi:hypothetical protein